MKVRDCMTLNPQTIHPTDVLSLAEEKMRSGRFRRLPVVDDAGTLLGIVTDGDLRQYTGYLPTTRVTAAMTESVETISADAAIEDAAERMLDRKIGGLPVVDGHGGLVGILTESDLLRSFLRQARASGAPGRSNSHDPGRTP